jgi:hypothetical protein
MGDCRWGACRVWRTIMEKQSRTPLEGVAPATPRACVGRKRTAAGDRRPPLVMRLPASATMASHTPTALLACIPVDATAPHDQTAMTHGKMDRILPIGSRSALGDCVLHRHVISCSAGAIRKGRHSRPYHGSGDRICLLDVFVAHRRQGVCDEEKMDHAQASNLTNSFKHSATSSPARPSRRLGSLVAGRSRTPRLRRVG